MGACISTKSKVKAAINPLDKITEEKLLKEATTRIFLKKVETAPILQLHMNHTYLMRMKLKNIEKSFLTEEGSGASMTFLQESVHADRNFE